MPCQLAARPGTLPAMPASAFNPAQCASADELGARCAAELAAQGVVADRIEAARDDAGRWKLSVVARGRAFQFGTLGRDGYYFIEKRMPRDVDFLGGLQQPDCEREEVLWRHSLALLRAALGDPHFGGPAAVVI